MNYDLPTKRVDTGKKYGERFDYFGFEEDQSNISRIEEYEEKTASEEYKSKNIILW